VEFVDSCKKIINGFFNDKPKITISNSSPDKITFLVKRTVKNKLEEGKRRLENGMVEEAIEEYSAAVDLDPSCGISQFNLGYAYHEDGQYKQAQEHYQKAIEIEPSCPYFIEHLARLNFENLEYSEADKLFKRASMIGVIQPLSIGLWGRALFEQERYEDSIEAFQLLINNEKQNSIKIGARYWQTLGNIRLGRMSEARKITEQMLRKKVADYKILYNLGEAFIESRCLDLARKIFEKIAIAHEEFLIARLRLEDIRSLEKEIEEMLPGLFEGDEEKLLYRIHALSEVGDERVSKALLAMIRSCSALVREGVVRYQTRYGYNNPNDLMPLLCDNTDFVRDAVFEYFSKLGNPKYLNQMRTGLRDEHIEIRRKCVSFLGRFSSIETLPELEMLSTDIKNKEISPEIRTAISQIKQRYQKNIDAMTVSCASSDNHRHNSRKKKWKFWFSILIQGGLIAYFVYFLLTRL
jgi:tetratricopeptide (TPR) repeat protein